MSSSMINSLAKLSEGVERTLLSMFLRKYHIFNKLKHEVKDIASDGLILDISGDGEGVINRHKGRQVIGTGKHIHICHQLSRR